MRKFSREAPIVVDEIPASRESVKQSKELGYCKTGRMLRYNYGAASTNFEQHVEICELCRTALALEDTKIHHN